MFNLKTDGITINSVLASAVKRKSEFDLVPHINVSGKNGPLGRNWSPVLIDVHNSQ